MSDSNRLKRHGSRPPGAPEAPLPASQQRFAQRESLQQGQAQLAPSVPAPSTPRHVPSERVRITDRLNIDQQPSAGKSTVYSARPLRDRTNTYHGSTNAEVKVATTDSTSNASSRSTVYNSPVGQNSTYQVTQNATSMNYPGVMQGPAVKGFSRLTQASASRPTIQQVTGQQADEESDDEEDEVPDEYPFQYLTDRDHQSIVRCVTLQDRIGLIEDNNKLWRKDTEGEQVFLRESVRFQRMALGKGKFFRHMHDARSDERKLLSDWVNALKATVEEQARLKGPLNTTSSCPTRQQSAKEPAKVVQRELLDVGSSEGQPSRALAVRKGFDLTAGFARSASSSYTVESQERLHSLGKDPNPPSAFGRRRVSTHSDKRDTTLDPRLPGNALQLTDPGELVATVQSQSLNNTALRPPRETKATDGYPATPNDSAPILRPSNETQTLGRLSKVVPDPKLPIEAVDPDDFKGPENRGFRDWSRAYQVRKSEFFRPGKVFAVLWPEPAGSSGNKGAASRFDPTEKNPNLIHGPRGEKIYVHPQRMVVIRTGHGYCWCVMINTYGGQGLLKGGFRQEDIDAHAIIYDSSQKPLALSSKGKAEPRSKKRAIAVDMEGQETLSPASRVHLGKPSTVEYNFKVMQVGQVVEADLQYLIASVKSELRI